MGKMEYGEQEEYISMFKTYLGEQTRYVEAVRSVKHDMQAHMVVLFYYIQENNFDKAKSYLMSIMDSQESCIYPMEDVGNDMVNAILYDALRKAEVSIDFHHYGYLPQELVMEDMDICILFSNLMSNAVEACNRVFGEKTEIYMEIQQQEGNLNIILENSAEHTVSTELLRHGSSKPNKEEHGYGIGNIRKIVQKYNGRLEFEAESGLFRVKIYFADIVKKNLVC